MMPDVQALYAVTEATWPPASATQLGPWIIRDGQGGGKRVSAATASEPVTEAGLSVAEQAMRDLGQVPLFMIRQGEAALDEMLAAQGYDIIDPVNMYCSPLAPLTQEPLPKVTAYTIWEPMAIQLDIWAQGGIGPARIKVMERAVGPKTSLFGRDQARPAATGFVALHDGIAMIHALEVLERHRRCGMGRHLTRAAAFWAAEHGATHLAVLCTKANAGANALYSSLGLSLVGEYHYRIKKDQSQA